jgi:hypothetical protein
MDALGHLGWSAPGFAAGGHGYNNVHRNPVNVDGMKAAFVFSWKMAALLIGLALVAYNVPEAVPKCAWGQLQLQQSTAGLGEFTTKLLSTVDEQNKQLKTMNDKLTKVSQKQEECCTSDTGNAGDDNQDQPKNKTDEHQQTSIPETDWIQDWFGSYSQAVLVLCGFLSAVLNNLPLLCRVVSWVVSQVTKCAIWGWNSEWAKAVSNWLWGKKEQQAVALPEIRLANVVMQTPAAAQQHVQVAAADAGGNVGIDTPALRTPRFAPPTSRPRRQQT